MKEVVIKDSALREAAEKGTYEFIRVFTEAINDSIGGALTAETMDTLGSDQITLLAYVTLHDEVMEGGLIQLIYNGYGAFIFRNPFAKAIKEWGIDELYRFIQKARPLYYEYHKQIERELTDDEFMALYEQMPAFDDFDDNFVENEELWTAAVAHYVDEHVDHFAKVV